MNKSGRNPESSGLLRQACAFALMAACIFAGTSAHATSVGLDTAAGTTEMPFSVAGEEIMTLSSNNGLTFVQPLPLNMRNVITINQGWPNPQLLTIDNNQIWITPLVSNSDTSLYLQNSTPGAAVVIGGLTETSVNHLYVHGGLITYQPFTTQYGASPQIFANGDNHTGGGIAISDDGGFYDYNDGWVTFNGSTGVRISGNNGAGSSGGNLLVTGIESVGTNAWPTATLDVGGEVRVGNSGAGCSVSNEGAMQYNWSTHSMNYCNGTAWTSMSGHLVATESMSNNGPKNAVLTSTRPHDLCIQDAGIWDPGHLYSFQINLYQNGDRTWTASNIATDANISLFCFDIQ